MSGTSPRSRWVGRGVRRWRSSRWSSSRPRWAGPPSSGRRYLSHAVEGYYRLKDCWTRLESGQLPAYRLAFIADRTMCLSPERRGSSTPTSRGGAHDRPGAAGPADRGGDRPVRPRAGRGRPLPPRARRWTSTSPRSAARARCASRATWTWPTRSTSTRRWLLMPTSSSSPARPSPWTCAVPSRLATWPATSSLWTCSQRCSGPAPRPRRSARWCCMSTSSTPRSMASGEVPVDWPGSRRPRGR